MLVKEIMSKNPDALSEEMTLQQAAAEMQRFDFGFLPIKHKSQIVGVVTDRDLVIRALADGLDPNQTKLKDVMTKELYYCHENDDVKEVANIMSQKKVNRIAVYDENERFAGVVSIGDIARRCHDTTLCGKLTEAIHQG